MSGLARFLGKLVGRLDSAGIPHMLTGSVASTYFGEPRQTRDVDLVVDPDPAALDRFAAAWKDDGYLDASVAREALAAGGMFNVLDFETGWKADLIVRKKRAFSASEFDRRRPARLLGVDTWIASPEDVILSKLEWAGQSGSTRQLDDATAVVRVTAGALDLAYLERWARDLAVEGLLARVLKEEVTGA